MRDNAGSGAGTAQPLAGEYDPVAEVARKLAHFGPDEHRRLQRHMAAEQRLYTGEQEKVAQGTPYDAFNSPSRGGLTLENVDHVFTYQLATGLSQVTAFDQVREACILLAKTILRVVPQCADRATALRKLRECRMDANAAIALDGEI